MNVNLKCFSSLVNAESCDYRESQTYRLTEGHTVGDLVDKAGIEKKGVKIAFVNSEIVDFDTVLADGDRVGLSPAVGGM
ncbi:MoaD/ThiS family protein [Thermodesulfobacteriota bacterium]